jgi:alpha-L-rhamnosidase
MAQPPRISRLTFGRNASPVGIGQSRPTLSWRYEQDDSTEPNWSQKAFELGITRSGGKEKTYRVDSGDNVELEWPKDESDLSSRERVQVRVRACGAKSGKWTEWLETVVEAALLERSDWSAKVVAPDVVPPANLAKRPFHVKTTFQVTKAAKLARLYATALGVYEISINGERIGDHIMAPGWQSYNHRLHYQTYEVPAELLVKGENTIEAIVGEGWYSGRLTWDQACRNLWGEEIGVMAQLEVDGKVVTASDTNWQWSHGALLSSELYDGETYDASLAKTREWRSTKTIPLPPKAALIAPEAPPIRPIEDIKPIELITTPSRKKILDFGQNLVGWVKVRNIPKRHKATDRVVLRFAEVLDKGELGVRPLRSAKATDYIYLSPDDAIKEWEPKFSTHGFRYCEVTGPAELLDDFKGNFTAVVVHSDMERIGDFKCSHDMVNKLHENVVWGLRGNFVGVPTDCPQRDERYVDEFIPTADTSVSAGLAICRRSRPRPTSSTTREAS